MSLCGIERTGLDNAACRLAGMVDANATCGASSKVSRAGLDLLAVLVNIER